MKATTIEIRSDQTGNILEKLRRDQLRDFCGLKNIPKGRNKVDTVAHIKRAKVMIKCTVAL